MSRTSRFKGACRTTSLPMSAAAISIMCLSRIIAAQTVDFGKVSEQILPSVVTIRGSSADGAVVGSGVIIDSSGIVATSLHVIDPLDEVSVVFEDGIRSNVLHVLAVDRQRDLALLRVNREGLRAVTLARASGTRRGQPVLLAGSGNGLSTSVTAGIVSAIRTIEVGSSEIEIVQTDAAANPGNSGGPLVNTSGEVIGILGFRLAGAEGQNFALSARHVQDMLDGPLIKQDWDSFRTNNRSQKADSPVNQRQTSARPLVYIDSLGTSTAAILIREGLMNRLSLSSGHFQLTQTGDEADLILSGIVFVYSDTGRTKKVLLRLTTRGGKIVWAREYGGILGSTASKVASSAAKSIIAALAPTIREKSLP